MFLAEWIDFRRRPGAISKLCTSLCGLCHLASVKDQLSRPQLRSPQRVVKSEGNPLQNPHVVDVPFDVTSLRACQLTKQHGFLSVFGVRCQHTGV